MNKLFNINGEAKEGVVSNEGTDVVMRVMDNTKEGEMSISSMEVAKNIHEFKQEFKCQDLTVEKWEEIKITNDENECIEEDVFVDEAKMEEKLEEKYLGDVISTDGRNLKIIQQRVAKGKGISIK